ncbi:hydrogenase nickel incorporation protein HypB [Cellulosilyticum sp. I15G10I2]|uniref:hydrogenase nickel incorporation protein HypB n=1 Tax=Cellulosilyticum sp. I15G10I2 TaxID=1892843 RepID=UPI00085C3910|nr:hydrogenase nickel incorporation protein HypB [Cellulosilyticum sp. I15G10I2]
MKQILVEKSVFESNNKIAALNKAFFNEQSIFTINLLGSPGSGKTSILENIIAAISSKWHMAIIEGDLYTAKDAERIACFNTNVVQVNTGGACHLDAPMIRKSLSHINTQDLDFLVIENIGNLVCPASYDLGEDMKIVIMSTTEGNDKPLKYPSMFQRASAVVLNKMDILPFTDFNKQEFYQDIYSLNETIKVFEVSCREGTGLNDFITFLTDAIKKKKDL